MQTITICGSMKYDKEMKDIALNLECENGYNVLQCVYNDNSVELTSYAINRLVSAHYLKIDLCDAIYVVDINNYIGKSTEEEITYAKHKGKEIFYHSTFISSKEYIK